MGIMEGSECVTWIGRSGEFGKWLRVTRRR